MNGILDNDWREDDFFRFGRRKWLWFRSFKRFGCGFRLGLWFHNDYDLRFRLRDNDRFRYCSGRRFFGRRRCFRLGWRRLSAADEEVKESGKK
jgi:hypothetical protein